MAVKLIPVDIDPFTEDTPIKGGIKLTPVDTDPFAGSDSPPTSRGAGRVAWDDDSSGASSPSEPVKSSSSPQPAPLPSPVPSASKQLELTHSAPAGPFSKALSTMQQLQSTSGIDTRRLTDPHQEQAGQALKQSAKPMSWGQFGKGFVDEAAKHEMPRQEYDPTAGYSENVRRGMQNTIAGMAELPVMLPKMAIQAIKDIVFPDVKGDVPDSEKPDNISEVLADTLMQAGRGVGKTIAGFGHMITSAIPGLNPQWAETIFRNPESLPFAAMLMKDIATGTVKKQGEVIDRYGEWQKNQSAKLDEKVYKAPKPAEEIKATAPTETPTPAPEAPQPQAETQGADPRPPGQEGEGPAEIPEPEDAPKEPDTRQAEDKPIETKATPQEPTETTPPAAPSPLRPAVKVGDKVYQGDEGQTHIDVMEDHFLESGERGFVDDKGKFLTREEAKNHLKENSPDLYDEWVKQNDDGEKGELHSDDLNKAAEEVAPEPQKAKEVKKEEAPVPVEEKKVEPKISPELKSEPILPPGMKTAQTVQSIAQSGVKTMLISDVNKDTVRNIASGEMSQKQAIEYLRRKGIDVLKKMPEGKKPAEVKAVNKPDGLLNVGSTVKVGWSPTRWIIEEELKPEKGDLLGERFFRVKNSIDGTSQIVEKGSFNMQKKKPSEIMKEAKDAGHTEKETADTFAEGEVVGKNEGAGKSPEEIERAIEEIAEEVGVESPVSPSLLSYMRDRIDMSEAGQRKKDDQTGEWRGISSSFPEWYRKAGFSGKKQALAVIDKAISTGDVPPLLQDAIKKGASHEYNELQKTRLQSTILGEDYDEQGIHERVKEAGHESILDAAEAVGRGSIRPDGGPVETAGETRKREAISLKKWAEENGLLIPAEAFTDKWNSTKKIAGKERQVIYDSFNGNVLKRKKLLSSETYGSYLGGLQRFNVFEPQAPYDLMGFSDVDGDLMPVERQRFIQGEPITFAELDKEMHKRGLTGDGGRYHDDMIGAGFNDIGENNAIKTPDGRVVVIDADVVIDAEEKAEEKPSSFALTPDKEKAQVKAKATESDMFGMGFATMGEGKKPAGEEKLTELEQAKETAKAEKEKVEFEGKQGALLTDNKPAKGVDQGGLSYEQRKANFDKWFGDSKVVDKKGEPLVVYHSTMAENDFESFKRRVGDVGIHFGTIEQAQDRSDYIRPKTEQMKNRTGGERIMPVFLSIKKPLRLPDLGAWNADNMNWKLEKLFPEDAMDIRKLKSTKDIREYIQSKGYDGIVYKNTGEVGGSTEYRQKISDAREAMLKAHPGWKGKNSFGIEDQKVPEYKAWSDAKKAYDNYREKAGQDSYIAFDPTQIKSATGNRGTFDPDNPSFLYGGGPSTEQITASFKKFFDEDIKPFTSGAVGGFSDTMRRITSVLSPRTGVKREVLDIAMGMKGQRDKAEFIIEKTTQHIEDTFSKMKREGQVDFIDRIKTGRPQPTPELQAVADFMRKTEDTLYAEASKYKPDASWIDNHYRVLWKTIPGTAEGKGGFSGLFRKPLQGSKGMFKQHTLNDMSEGLDKGGVPYSYNPMTMWKMGYADLQKFVTAQKMMESFKKQGLAIFGREFSKAPEGMKKVDDPMFRVFFKEGKHFKEKIDKETGEISYVPATDMIAKAGEWYIDEGAARILNNFISRDMVREVAAGRGLLWLKNSTTAVELSLSAFHATFETLETVGSSIGLGLNKIWNRGVVRGDKAAIASGLHDILTAPVSPFTTAKLGGMAIKYISQEDFKNTPEGKSFLKQYPDAEQLIDDLFTGGGKLAMHQDYKINSIRTFKDNIANDNYIGAALRALPAANEMLMEPLFEQYIPRLKIGMFLKEHSSRILQYEKELASGEMTRAEVARKTWDFVEDRLGEMNFDNLFWNRTFKSAMQIMFRSVTWKLGNLRATGGAFKGQSTEFLNAIKEKRMPELHSNMAWLLGMTAVTAALSSTIMYLSTGKAPSEVKDFVYPQIDENDSDIRISTPTYWKDLISLYHSPTGYAKSSLSSWVGRTADIWQNRDFYGTEVRHEDDPLWKQAFDVSKHMVPLPFSVQSYAKMKDEDQSPSRKALGFMGMTKAPGYISMTDFEKFAHEKAADHMPQGTRTSEQAEHLKFKKQLTAKLKANPEEGHSELVDAVKEGKISRQERHNIQAAAKSSHAAWSAKNMSLEDLDKAVSTIKLTDEEKQELYPIFKKKISSKWQKGELDRDKKAAYMDHLRSLKVEAAEE